MTFLITTVMATALALLALPVSAQSNQTIFDGGLVWTGTGFEPRTLTVENGRFIDPSNAHPDAERVSLAGRFITPAYANAHAHVTQPTPESSRGFTDAGVFYVWNPNTVVMDPSAREFFGREGRVSVKVSQGGITEPGGHPEKLHVDILGPSIYGGRPREWFLGNAFHYGTSEAEIEEALLTLKQQGADFVKIYLLRSEDYDARRNDPEAYGARGLNPANVAFLVGRAHALGLPVVAHLETAHDLRVAAEARVDYAAHLPAYGVGSPEELQAARLTSETVASVARSGMRVVPTYALANGGDQYGATISDEVQRVIAVQTRNLDLLREAGVDVLIGTDGFNQIFTEAEHLVEANGVAARDVASIVFTTGAILFPERRIGCFDPGCEADFLVLAADPSADIRALRRIERRVMAGRDVR